MEDNKDLEKQELDTENIENDEASNSNEAESEYEEFETIIEEKEIDENDTEELELRDIELKLQELEIKVDEYEFKYAEVEKMDEETFEKYLILKQEYKDLLKQKKTIIKNKKKALGDNSIEQVSMWIFLYGIIMDIISFPFIAYIIYLNWGSWLIGKLSTVGSLAMESFFEKTLLWIIIFILPIALMALTLTIYFNFLKKKIDKKVFSIFGILQALFTLGSIIWLSIVLFN